MLRAEQNLDKKSSRDRLGPLALVPKSYNKKWNKDIKKKVFSYEDMDQGYETYWNEHTSVVEEYIIKPETVSKVLEKCKEWNIGFTAYTTTAFLRWLGCLKRPIIIARQNGNRIRKFTTSKIGIDKVFRPFHIHFHNFAL